MTRLKNWLPALAMMTLIFAASSIPGDAMIRFDEFDFTVKKLGHSVGYALLAASYLRGLGKRPWLAWLLAVLFAFTDEFHQSFTPGRNPSLWDVLIFDNFGALTGAWLYHFIEKRKTR